MNEQMNVGLKTIAYEMDLSVTAVSKALRDCPDISESTKEAVRKKAQELGYVPNFISQSLRYGKTNTIAIIFDKLNSGYFSIMADFIAKKLYENNFNVLILPCPSLVFDEKIFQSCIAQRVSGIITFLEPTEGAAQKIGLSKIPVAMVGRKVGWEGVDTFYTDDEDGGRQAVDYLLKKGCKNLLYIGYEIERVECAKRRREGFAEEAKRRGVKCFYLEDESPKEDFVEYLRQNEINGIFAFNDGVAIKYREFIKSADREFSKQIKFIGYDGIQDYLPFAIKIPSISFDYKAIAHDVCDLLMRKIKTGSNSERIAKCYPVHVSGK